MKNLKRILSMLLTVILAFTLAACAPKADNATKIEEKPKEINTTYPLKIKDSYDREVTIEKEPKRVISIAPNITETVYALEKKDVLVGRTDYCDYPAEVSAVQSIGTLKAPNLEKITELKPDLVIASTHFSKDTLKKLEELNIPTVVLYGSESFEGVYETIEKVGQVLNANMKASSIITAMKQKVSSVEEKVKGKNTPSVYYVVGYGESGDFTATGDTFIGNMIKMAGGKNVAEDAVNWKYSLEKLVEKDPQLIIVSKYYDTKAGFMSAKGYKELSAVKGNKVLEIDNNLLDRQGPRLADGLEALAKLIQPDAFK
jgi:iron complex transport system substrate-binding protein